MTRTAALRAKQTEVCALVELRSMQIVCELLVLLETCLAAETVCERLQWRPVS
jgi:hypothetical protein